MGGILRRHGPTDILANCLACLKRTQPALQKLGLCFIAAVALVFIAANLLRQMFFWGAGGLRRPVRG